MDHLSILRQVVFFRGESDDRKLEGRSDRAGVLRSGRGLLPVGGHFLNEYYIVSEAETRKLMNHPEVVGYEVYASLVTATSQMMYYLKEKRRSRRRISSRYCGAL